MTHWKKLIDPELLGSYEIPSDKDSIVTIRSAQKETIKTKGGSGSKFIIRFAEINKPWICNVKNGKSISNALKENQVENWIGKQIQLYVTTEECFGEKDVEVIRVRQFAPAPLIPLDPTDAISKIGMCKTMDELKLVFTRLTRPEQGNVDVNKAKDELKIILTK